MEDYIFSAETSNGYTIKVLIEVLQNCISRDVYFHLNKTGINLCCTDNKETILIHADLKRENFDNYKILNDLIIVVNLKKIYKLIKNIKKKDNITLYIDKKDSNKLHIVIMPTINGRKDRVEESTIVIEKREEDADVNYDPPDASGYYPCKNIPSSEYQKMCKKMDLTKSKSIIVTIQESRYVSFSTPETSDATEISSKHYFGELNPSMENIYKEQFFNEHLCQLIKMAGFDSKLLQIYAPKDLKYPLKVCSQTRLGMVEAYIKNIKTLNVES